MKSNRSAAVAVGVFLTSAAVYAGNGTVTKQESGGALEKIVISTKVYIDVPRTQDQMDEFKRQIRNGARGLCDTTDGLISVEEVQFVNGRSQRAEADIVWYQRDARPWSGGGVVGATAGNGDCGPYATDGLSKISVYGLYEPGNPWAGPNAELFMHEWSHGILGLSDQYSGEDGVDRLFLYQNSFAGPHRRTLSGLDLFYNPATGGKFAISPFALAGDTGAKKLNGDPLYDKGSANTDWWLQNNAVNLGASGQVCRRPADGLAPSEVNPFWSNTQCMSDDDCQTHWSGGTDGAPVAQAGDFSECWLFGIPNNSELAVNENTDQDRFNRNRGEDTTPVAVGSEDFSHPARQVVLSGLLYATSPSQPSGSVPARDGADCLVRDGMGVCTDACATQNGGVSALGTAPTASNPEIEFQCAASVGSTSHTACPGGSTNPSSPNNGSFTSMPCDACIAANTTSCAPPVSGMCGNGDIDIVPDMTNPEDSMFEQCDPGTGAPGPVIDPRTGDPLRCEDLYSPYAESPDGLGLSYADASPRNELRGGIVRCQSNCLFDLSQCTYKFRPGEFDDTSGDGMVQLVEAADQSTRWLVNEVYGPDGEVAEPLFEQTDPNSPDYMFNPTPSAQHGSGPKSDRLGDSNHALFVFLRESYRYRVPAAGSDDAWPTASNWTNLNYREVWLLTFGMDETEFGGDEGVLKELRTFELEFDVDYAANTGTLRAINGRSFSEFDFEDESTWPEILRLSSGDPVAINDDWGQAPDPGTAALDLPTILRLDVSALAIGQVEDWDCSASWAAGRTNRCTRRWNNNAMAEMHARHNIRQVGDLWVEEPQYLNIESRYAGEPDNNGDGIPDVAQFYHRYSFNNETKQYSSSRATIEMLHAAGYWDIPSPPSADPDDFIKSDWENLATNTCKFWGIDITSHPAYPTSVSDIDPEPPEVADCGDVTFSGEEDMVIPAYDVDTEIIFSLDRSGSMSQEDVGDYAQPPKSRLDYVKYAAHSFFDSLRPTPPDLFGPKVGVVYFANDPQVVIPPPGAELRSAHGELPTADFENQLVPSDHPNVAESPIAEGATGSAASLDRAGEFWDDVAAGDSVKPRIVAHMSDGIYNIPGGGTCIHIRPNGDPHPDHGQTCGECGGVCSEADDAYKQAIDDLKDDKEATLWEFPLYYAGWGDGIYQTEPQAAKTFAGARPDGADMAPLFFQGYVHSQSQQVARSHLHLPEFDVTGDYHTPLDYPVEVEEGAERLVVNLTDYDDDENAFLPYQSVLVDPDGERYNFSHPSDPVVNPEPGVMRRTGRNGFSTLSIEAPKAGTWVFEDQTQHSSEPKTPAFYVSAWIDNPAPGCTVTTGKKIFRDGDEVIITAEAVYERPVIEGVTFKGMVIQADGHMHRITFNKNSVTQKFEARVPESALVGRGLYRVQVTCSVEEGAPTEPGEEGEFASQIAHEEIVATKFSRDATTYFLYYSATQAPIPGWGVGSDGSFGDDPGNERGPSWGANDEDEEILGELGLPNTFGPWVPSVGDADNDNIPNDEEPPPDVDTDGDGVPDVIDPDANNNDIPDGEDPAIVRNPGSTDGGSCTLENAAYCCSEIGRCIGGVAGISIYAEGGLHLADRVEVGEPALPGRIVNTGSTGTTHIGVDTFVGTTMSQPGVFLAERATVDGNLVTGGSVTRQSGTATVTGIESTGVTVGFPKLSEYQVDVEVGSEQVVLEPETARTLEPGSYAALDVRSRSSVYLSSGVYHFSQFFISPEATLSLDLSGGPIYVFVEGEVKWEGTQVVTGGDPSHFYLASMGTGTVQLERGIAGTFVVPNGALRLAPLNGAGEFQGAFFGASVEVHPDNSIGHARFPFSWRPEGVVTPPTPTCTDGVLNQGELQVDCGGPCEDCTGGSEIELAAALNVTSSWEGGYCADVAVTNIANEATSDWSVQLDLGNTTIDNLWNGTATGASGLVVVDAANYNAVIAPSASRAFGFCATRVGSIEVASVIAAAGF